MLRISYFVEINISSMILSTRKELKMAFEFDSEIHVEAMEKADEILRQINLAINNPLKSINGEALRTYEELDAWGLFESFPLKDNIKLYKMFISMTQYRHLKWAKDHPTEPKNKKSKWEYVMGKSAPIKKKTAKQ